MRTISSSNLVFVAFLATSAVLFSSSVRAACQTAPPPRMIIKVASYGAESVEDRKKLKQFIDIIYGKSVLWKEDIGSLALDAPFLKEFGLFLDQDEVISGKVLSPQQARDYWKTKSNTLQILYGAVIESLIHSAVLLGSVERSGQTTIVNVFFAPDARDAAKITDMHSMLVYYALGIESYQLQCPTPVVNHFLTKAFEIGGTILTRSSDETESETVRKVIDTITSLRGDLK
jgi:hypothetical protein